MPAFLSDQQVTELRRAHKAVRDKRIADKIKAVLMLHHGYSYDQIHEALLLDEATVRRHVIQYEHQGVDGLLECRY
ncbi:helix-turn-helix domain-containing protein, partial [Candidatus Gottesmanbacteria bacterium]|nr:helix-turn-helix domain-containing protein [Candidatus Gottesmanbacteria bacterium]